MATALLFSCAQEGRGSSSPGSSAAPVGSGTATSTVLSDAVRNKVCQASPCGGDQSQIRVFRDDAGAVKRLYRLYGACSHSPGIYFDPAGTETETIPEKPIMPGSDAEKTIKAKHDAQIGGLKHTDTISCDDGSRTAP